MLHSPLVGRRILVVEDEVMIAWPLQDLAGRLRLHRPQSRDPGQRGTLAMIDAEAIDAVVLDVNLNGQSELPRRRQAGAVRRAVCLFDRLCRATGSLERYRGFPMVQKPYHRSEMQEALEGLFCRKRRTRRRRDARVWRCDAAVAA